jgi:ribose 5-phosphate isomerase B|tara:strand:- start:811 stop:1251 length:441 start_codon:yes stop_codon:yes gene_type:complete
MKQKIILAADHAGFELKEEIKDYLEKEGYETEDVGAHEYNESDDYPDFMIPAAKKVAKENCFGIILGGSGQGEAMAANKVKGARTAVYYGKNPDIIKLSKTHNNANILSLGARFLTKKEAIEAVGLWLKTNFQDEERHARRIKKLE